MTVVRQSAVAGAFYPGSAKELGSAVQGYLNDAGRWDGPVPKAIIAPHAGYVYSGPVAATAYARLAPARDRITRVVLLGPCHRIPVRGLAASGADAFVTPLGQIPVDRDAISSVLDMPQVQVTLVEDHEPEGPFGAKGVGEIGLVPTAAAVAGALEAFDGVRRYALPMKDSPAGKAMTVGRIKAPKGRATS